MPVFCQPILKPNKQVKLHTKIYIKPHTEDIPATFRIHLQSDPLFWVKPGKSQRVFWFYSTSMRKLTSVERLCCFRRLTLSLLAWFSASSIDSSPFFTLFIMLSCISLLSWEHQTFRVKHFNHVSQNQKNVSKFHFHLSKRHMLISKKWEIIWALMQNSWNTNSLSIMQLQEHTIFLFVTVVSQ